MQKLSVFNQVSLDGYFVDANQDMSWARKTDLEWTEFAASNARSEGSLLFGRKTYDMMAGFWPTPMAAQTAPVVAQRMNAAPKVVFSRTMNQATWNNTRLVKGDLVAEVGKMKEAPGPGLVIFGSGSIVSQLAQANLIDEYQVAINPIVLGSGRTMFDGVTRKLNLKLTQSRAFTNGNVFLVYQLA